jgi:hypothetical protein
VRLKERVQEKDEWETAILAGGDANPARCGDAPSPWTPRKVTGGIDLANFESDPQWWGKSRETRGTHMKKLRPLLLAIPLTLAALASVPSARAQAVCNLDCIIGDHCCIIDNKAECIPNAVPCP